MNRIGKSYRFWTLLVFAAAGLTIAMIIQAAPLAIAFNPAGLSGLSLAQEGPRSCCIAGKYKGTRQATAGTCPGPATETFSMEIFQGKKCEADISGTIVGDSDPTQIQKFTGTVTPSSTKGCCDMKGKFTTPTEVTEFQGIFCRKGNKWSATGTYKSTDAAGVCSGKWKMDEI
jgi:hypothetical protein